MTAATHRLAPPFAVYPLPRASVASLKECPWPLESPQDANDTARMEKNTSVSALDRLIL